MNARGVWFEKSVLKSEIRLEVVGRLDKVRMEIYHSTGAIDLNVPLVPGLC